MSRRVALVGYGLAGAAFHAPLIDACEGLTLSCVVTSDGARGRAARSRYSGIEVLTDTAPLWSRGDIDLVVIATPNSSHMPLALQSIDAGIAVVVDKPLAASVADAERVVEAALRARVPLSVFHNRRWDSDFLTLRGLIEGGALGRVQRFESRFERWRPQRADGWRQDAAAGAAGGALFDLGSHLIDQALQLFGPVRSVYAELDLRHPQAEVDDDSFIALGHVSGTRSHLWMGSMSAHAGPRLRVLGSEAAFVVEGMDPQEAALRAGADPAADAWGAVEPALWGRLHRGDHVEPVAAVPGAYTRFYAGMLQTLESGAAVPVDPADAVRGLRVIEAARESANRGRLVELA